MVASVHKDVIIFEDNQGRQPFTRWLETLDTTIRGRIQNRILRLHHGNYGDYKALQEGIKELRFHFGVGYRVYSAEDGSKIVILLHGGDKHSQSADIRASDNLLERL